MSLLAAVNVTKPHFRTECTRAAAPAGGQTAAKLALIYSSCNFNIESKCPAARRQQTLFLHVARGPVKREAHPHAQKSAVLSINIGHPVALPAAPHFLLLSCAERIPVVSAGYSVRRVVAALGRILCSILEE